MPRTLEARWRDLDAQIRTWWDGDLHRATEAEIAADPKGTLLYLPHPYSSAAGAEAAAQSSGMRAESYEARACAAAAPFAAQRTPVPLFGVLRVGERCASQISYGASLRPAMWQCWLTDPSGSRAIRSSGVSCRVSR